MISSPLLLLSLALLLGGDPIEAPCEDDPRCEADRLLSKATASESAAHRVKFGIAAYRLRLSLFQDTGEIADLCAARSALDLSLAEEQAAQSQRHLALDTHLKFSATYHVPLKSCSMPEPAAVPLIDPRGDGPLRLAQPTPEVDSPSLQAPAHRGLRIAGATLMGLGVGLVSAGGYGLGRMISARRSGYALGEERDASASAELFARDAELREAYRVNSRLALGAGITGGVAVIVGAALLGVHRRQRSRRGRSAAIFPTTSGFVLSARF